MFSECFPSFSIQNFIKEDNKNPKLLLVRYYLLNKSTLINVCKIGFLSVYAISLKLVEHLITLLRQNDTPHDLRGKIPSGNAVSADVVLAIAMHISYKDITIIYIKRIQIF